MQAGGPVNTRKVLTNESVDPNIFGQIIPIFVLLLALVALSLALVLLFYGMLYLEEEAEKINVELKSEKEDLQ